jgi:hypothetical protein
LAKSKVDMAKEFEAIPENQPVPPRIPAII